MISSMARDCGFISHAGQNFVLNPLTTINSHVDYMGINSTSSYTSYYGGSVAQWLGRMP